MSARVKFFLYLVLAGVVAIIIDRKTGGKISGLIARIPVVGPQLVG